MKTLKLNDSSLNRVESMVAKGEIAHDEQFLLLPPCFQIVFAVDSSNASVGGKGLSIIEKLIPHSI